MPSTGSGSATGTPPVAPPRAGWPTVADVVALVGTAGLTLTNAQVAGIDAQLAAAITAFERATNRTPVLAPPADTTRQLHPPVMGDGVLHLDRDLAVLTSVAYQPQGGTSSPLTAQQYLAEPVNAPADGRPYERLILTYRGWMAPLYYPQRASIYVTGRWGYATFVPADIWLAVLYQAAGVTLGAQRFGATGGIKSWADGNRRLEYGGMQDWLTQWGGYWQTTVANYRRRMV